MSIRQAARRVAVSAAALAAMGTFSIVTLSGSASATTPVAQSVVIDAGDSNGASHSFTPGTPYSSGQLVEVTVPENVANGGDGPLASDTNFTTYECADPGGSAANLPTDISACDSETANGTNGTTGDDGSVDYTDYEIRALPDTVGSSKGGLGESAGHLPICNLSNPCVLAVITDPNNFTDPSGIAFSQPFLVQPNATDNGANPGDGTPEAPLAIGLPLAGAAVIGGVLFMRRRKSMAATTA